ncbi:winged helix-turn-helix domain-containing protein [Humibacillus xanthopallidus]|uniref:Transcriptional regulator n=1 Tax=Humibacillus xanthopallidus TaxID=412689 RepID=A0A543HGD3_9MICO|nr:winged helix-turn-helix domain-containing protein [Humibacillus xanthopallidus]TQM57378.1 transcriptional regulator [Humibacillus xanthopallidus]
MNSTLPQLDDHGPRNCVVVAMPATRPTHQLVRYLLGMDIVPFVIAEARHLRYLADLVRIDFAVLAVDVVVTDSHVERGVADLDVPVLLLGDTARTAVVEPSSVLAGDTDDFEVAIEVRRQMTGLQHGRLAFGALELDVRRHVATWSGRDLELTPTQFRILSVLVRASGRVVSRRELCRRAMGTHGPGDEARLEAHLRRLRSRIETAAAEPLLVTVRGEGIRLADAIV